MTIAEDRDLYITYKGDGSKKRGKWHMGLLAQEALSAEKSHTNLVQGMNEDCEQVADEGLVVSGTHETGYRITYDKLVPPLIKAVQELSAENDALKARVTTLEG